MNEVACYSQMEMSYRCSKLHLDYNIESIKARQEKSSIKFTQWSSEAGASCQDQDELTSSVKLLTRILPGGYFHFFLARRIAPKGIASYNLIS